MNTRSLSLVCTMLILVCATVGVRAEELSGNLMIFHAGSLSVPLKEVADAFQKEYPSVRVLREAAGSRECARKISDLGRACDVMASSDYAVIDSMLIPKYANWNIKFAGNEMAIAYAGKSRYAREISSDNWPQVLLRDDVVFGRSDPDADPCGYRTILTMKLAARHYRMPDLANQLSQKDQRYVRPKETDLLALLETNSIDYMFIYRSVAEQHGLEWLALPDEINLKKAELVEHYHSASVEISGDTPGTKVVQYGEPMIYGVTIPINAPNPKAALAFVTFLLDKERGMVVLERNGQPGVVPAPTATYDQLPESLKRFAVRP